MVTYNGEKYVRPLLESLNLLEYPRDSFKLIIIDNASEDGTIKEIKKYRNIEIKGNANGRKKQNPSDEWLVTSDDALDVEVVECEKNLGFAGGNNLGMRMAMDEGYEYIILLNQDMVVEKDWLGELVEKAVSDDKIGVVQAMMMLMSDKEKIYSTGDRLNFLGIGYSGNYQLPIFNFQLRTNIIAYAGGAGVLFKREVLEKIGLFEEMFFAYHEDSDLSWRARMAGFEIALGEKAVCYHDYKFGHNPKTFYWTERNRLMFLWRCFEIKTLILIFPAWLLMDIGMLGYALVTGWFWQKVRAYGWFLKNWGKILKARKKIQRERRVRDRDLKKYLVSGVEFGGLENDVLKYIANPVMRLYWMLIGWLI